MFLKEGQMSAHQIFLDLSVSFVLNPRLNVHRKSSAYSKLAKVGIGRLNPYAGMSTKTKEVPVTPDTLSISYPRRRKCNANHEF